MSTQQKNYQQLPRLKYTKITSQTNIDLKIADKLDWSQQRAYETWNIFINPSFNFNALDGDFG